jgi:hypothetical protein
MSKEEHHTHVRKNQDTQHLASTKNHPTKNQNHQDKRRNKILIRQETKTKQTTILRAP